MDGHIVARRIKVLQGSGRFGAALDDLLIGEEGIDGLDLHPECRSLAADEPADVAEGLDTQGLALDLGACGGGELGARHENHQRDGQFRDGVAVLSGGILHDDAMGRGGGKVHIVIAGACTHDDLEPFRGVQHLCGHLVGTDDHRIGIRDGSDQVGLLRIFLKGDEFMPRGFDDFPDTGDGGRGKGFLGSKKYFHSLLRF